MAHILLFFARELGDGSRVVKLKTNEAITITVRLPRHTWPEHLILPDHHSPAAVRLLRGRLTGREAILVIRIEGSIHEIQEALLYWEGCGFTVEKDDAHGIQDPRPGPGNRTQPSLQGRGSPFRGSRGLLS
jgi:hypothetical protein